MRKKKKKGNRDRRERKKKKDIRSGLSWTVLDSAELLLCETMSDEVNFRPYRLTNEKKKKDTLHTAQ